jgi:glycosyltransferase involved in cell wall biosynthesis
MRILGQDTAERLGNYKPAHFNIESHVPPNKPTMKTVSAIIPTLASADRRDQLLRAVRSIQQSSVFDQIAILVVVNGSRWDSATVSLLESLEGVTVHRLPAPSLPKAISHGRAQVATEFFCFLDDDDELLPPSIEQRLHLMRAQPAVDLVVSNGVRRIAGIESRAQLYFPMTDTDPLRALFRENWLASCGGLFRTSAVGQQYFDNYHDYAEWTWLAYQLAMDGKSFAFIDEVLFVINDTINSRSKSLQYRTAFLDLYRKMLERNPPPNIADLIQARISDSLHDISEDHLERGELLKATRTHIQSMRHTGGIRFISYSRHIVVGIFRRLLRI